MMKVRHGCIYTCSGDMGQSDVQLYIPQLAIMELERTSLGAKGSSIRVERYIRVFIALA